MENLSLFIFRQDLRLYDNLALIDALQGPYQVLPLFVFDKNLLNSAKSHINSFLFDAIDDLKEQFKAVGGRLLTAIGTPAEVVSELITEYPIKVVTVSEGYSPYSRSRDDVLKTILGAKDIEFRSHHNQLLNHPESIKSKSNKPYKVFTPFFNTAKSHQVNEPIKLKFSKTSFISPTSWNHNVVIGDLFGDFVSQRKPDIKGGRDAGLNHLNSQELIENYAKTRDFPYIATTRLAAYLKFGCISPREAYHVVGKQGGYEHELIRQLYWRDFYTYIGYHFPYVFQETFIPQLRTFPWDTNRETLTKWAQGMTGFPIVDAGMRELNATGFMHNRVRMITASFLTKDLLLPWKWGEKYFAMKLTDHDISVNNGSWQWAASTGTDAVPYFRIFNPWRQQMKYDPECEYIKQWVPELRELHPKDIHKWEKVQSSSINYPKPMINHSERAKLTKSVFKEILGKPLI